MWERDARFAVTRPSALVPGLRVLLIEDHDASRKLARVMLTAVGIEKVVGAADGKAGIKAFEAGGFNLVICDMMMPGLSGLDVLKVVREKHRHLPFIMLTAISDAGVVSSAKDAGVSAYLVKPISFNDLRSKISYALEKYALSVEAT